MHLQLALVSSFVAAAVAQNGPFQNLSTTTSIPSFVLQTTTESSQTLSTVGNPLLTSTDSSPSATTTPIGPNPTEPLHCGDVYGPSVNNVFEIFCNAVAAGLTFFSTETETLLGCIDACILRDGTCAAAQFNNLTEPATCNLKTVQNDSGLIKRQNVGSGGRGTFAAVRLNAAGDPVAQVSPVANTATSDTSVTNSATLTFSTLTFSNSSTITSMTGNPTAQPTLNYFTSDGSICYIRSALVSAGNTVSIFPLPTA